MPGYTEHCQHSFERYGVSGKDVHQWMDEPIALYGGGHRKVRHDPNQCVPKMFVEKYGLELARDIMIDHILLDQKTWEPNLEEVNRKTREMADRMGVQKLPSLT